MSELGLQQPTFYTNKQKRHIFERINSLSSTEHEEILKIVRRHHISFSQNKNGVFFNLTMLPHEVIGEIDRFVSYCVSNKKELDEYDKIINECKMNNRIDGVIPVVSTSLTEMAKTSTSIDATQAKQSWSTMKVDNATVEKFIKFTERVSSEREKLSKKKINVKFNNAKKKYAKKVDKKIEADLKDELTEEAYITI